MTAEDKVKKARGTLMDLSYTSEVTFSLIAVLTDAVGRVENADMKNCLLLLTNLAGETVKHVNEVEELICNSKA